MANDFVASDRLQLTLARTTAAALAVSSVEGDVFGELARRLAGILEVDATMIAQFIPDQPGRVRSLATWYDGGLLSPFEYDVEHSPCRDMVDRESRFVASGVHDEFAPGTLFHAQGFDSYAAHSMVDADGYQIGLIAAMHRRPLADPELTAALLQIFAVRATAELERRRVEDAARASETSYRSVFDASEEAIFVHDFHTGRIVDVNPQACRAYGYTREELLGIRISDVSSNVPPYTEADAIEKIEQAKRGGPVRFEWHRRNKDGSLHWDEVVLKTATIGGTSRILAFTREITQRKEAEQALRLREEQYRAIFDGSADALVLWNRDIRIVDVNAAFTAMYGFTRDEIIGSTFGDRLPTIDVARRIRLMHRALAGENGQLETRTIRKNGEAFDVEIRYLPIQHRGEPHVLAIARDVTERRRAEQRLKASEERYRLLFELESDAIMLADAETLQILDVNRAALAMYGYTREELLGISWRELSAEPALRTTDVLEGDGTVTLPLRRHRRKDRSEFLVEATLSAFELDGRRIELAAIRDVSERYAREQALQRSEEQYRAIFDGSADALVLWNKDFRIVDVNAAFCQIYGYAREEVIGATFGERQPPETVRLRKEMMRRALAGEPCQLETITVGKSGAPFEVELRYLPIMHRGEPHVLAIGRDITERRGAEARLRASEERYRQLFGLVSDAIVLVDSSTMKIVDANHAAIELYGYSRDELLGLTAQDLSAEPASTRDALGRSDEALSIPLRWHRRKDGSVFPVEIVANRFELEEHTFWLATVRDITDRHEREQALQRSEEQYRAIFNASADALVLWDSQYRRVDVNLAYEKMYGWKREDVLGRGYEHPVFPPEYSRPRLELVRRALAGEQCRAELEAIRSDGTRLWTEVHAIPFGHRGEPHVLAIARDITERKRTEQALRDSEEQYRSVFNASADGMYLRDADYRIVDVNPAYLAMKGFTREELIGADTVLPASTRTNDEWRAQHMRILAGEPAHYEARAARKDGTWFDVEVRGIPLMYGGQPHVLYTARDITERKRAEQALRDSEEQYRAIFNASTDGLFLRDADFRMVDVNPAYLAMKGFSREELIGTTRIFSPSAEDETERRAIHKRVLAGGTARFETASLRKDGSWFDVEVRAMPVLYHGQPHVLYSVRDIMERRRAEADRRALEAQLLQAQKMEAIGHLTGGIAHDFNNILTSVMGYMVLAAERPAAEADAKLRDHLDQAQLACRRARDLIQQMLTFSRGRRSESRPVALQVLVDESTRLLRAMLPSTLDLAVRINCKGAVAQVDPVQAQQILLNLCINARDAMHGVGRINIECREVALETATCSSCRRGFHGRYVELSVSDSGSGIAPHVFERMFEPFFSTKEVGQGTGMGLAMVHGIVHDQGGHLIVETRVGRGTTFRVLLRPAQVARTEDVSALEPASTAHRPLDGRVLLVDDEESVLGFMRQLLEGWGLEVVTARHPDDALNWIESEPDRFDVVLTDQTMPGMTGIDLAREIVRVRPDMPVLLYSGHSELLRMAPTDAAGIVKVLTKPVDPAEMRAALAESLPGH